MHAVRLASGLWVANLHAEKQPRPRPLRDIERAGTALFAWAAEDAPLVFGGDLHIRDPEIEGLTYISRHGLDHVFARHLERAGRGQVLDPRPLSDHRPILTTLT